MDYRLSSKETSCCFRFSRSPELTKTRRVLSGESKSSTGGFDYRYHNKVHYPNCGCRYNRRNLYLVDILDKNTKTYRHLSFYNRQTLNDFLESRHHYYSVCINSNTPIEKLNGGIIFIVSPDKGKDYENNFKSNSEIKYIKFYKYQELVNSISQFNEYENFAPIRNTIDILSKLQDKDLVVLICEEGFNGNHTFPKGKRMLDENSIDCGRREFKEETGIQLDDNILSQEYQMKARHQIETVDLPTRVVVYNCLFQIILYI